MASDTANSQQLPDRVTLVEMGARDGLQNQPEILSAGIRSELINRLARTGLKRIEAGSFVSPKAVPQMADSHKVFDLLHRQPGITYGALTPNLKGFEAALVAGADEVAVFASASEGFSQKNINCSIAQSLQRFEPVMAAAKKYGLNVRGYVSCVMGCPYDGDIRPSAVAGVAEQLWQMGCYEISLGDTTGVGTPLNAKKVLEHTSRHIPVSALAAHFHNTYGQALANVLALLEEGLSVIDSSVAGLGGCPYAPGASGNLATEDVVYMLHGMGIKTGINMEELLKAATFICDQLGIPSRSNAGLALSRSIQPSG
ncbi:MULTISPECIES: hydroxymethylglutaryl-CoA lyase [Gammaproteobacteria]|uniref:hydroxymethylglutaryl-CoA lyase n=1 Tax=Gammaproteobacteria TaxID=1236 RepID=UPI001ADCD63E|nr:MULTISPECIES: hydroxymethylglutaryl-CoA lyase [Gammaproteobacteria]MBO9480579.1 hydroxymethylglutaryl-CoA lyase [Salinisphaera sp. G21_0]MBO9494700.1 hydroxymethylglutaryl-CoA lyase [Thalassotalea sp. G20_0]